MSPKWDAAPETGCRRLVLAKGVTSDVDYCPHCRMFHLNMGAMSLRLPPTALRDLTDTLGAAVQAYRRVQLLEEAHGTDAAVRTEDVH